MEDTWDTQCEQCGQMVKYRQTTPGHMGYTCPNCGNEQMDDDGLHGEPDRLCAHCATMIPPDAHLCPECEASEAMVEQSDPKLQETNLGDDKWEPCVKCGEPWLRFNPGSTRPYLVPGWCQECLDKYGS